MTNADRIRQMDECELTDFLNQWAKTPLAWKKDPGETLYWLQQGEEESDPYKESEYSRNHEVWDA